MFICIYIVYSTQNYEDNICTALDNIIKGRNTKYFGSCMRNTQCTTITCIVPTAIKSSSGMVTLKYRLDFCSEPSHLNIAISSDSHEIPVFMRSYAQTESFVVNALGTFIVSLDPQADGRGVIFAVCGFIRI